MDTTPGMADSLANERRVCGLGHERCKRSNDIVVGDVIVAFGTPHLVRSIDPYEGPFDFVVGVARAADGWGISLTTTGCLEVA